MPVASRGDHPPTERPVPVSFGPELLLLTSA